MGDASVQTMVARLKKFKQEGLEKVFFAILELFHPIGQDHQHFMDDLRESKFSSGRTCPY